MENFTNQENFGNLEVNGANVAQEAQADSKKAEKRRKLHEMKEKLQETLHEDPEFQKKVGSLSGSLAVTRTLAWKDKGNIVVDESTKHLPKDQRLLVQASQIVGYRVQNVGQAPVQYQIESFQKDESGKFVGTITTATIAPGATADLPRKYMTILCAQPEFSFTLSNGKIVRGSGKKGKSNDLDAELEAHYFSFDDKDVKVHSDSIKLQVGQEVKDPKGGKVWRVKPEFEAYFGFLNNEKVAKKGGRASKGEKPSTQVMAANYINRMLKESGSI